MSPPTSVLKLTIGLCLEFINTGAAASATTAHVCMFVCCCLWFYLRLIYVKFSKTNTITATIKKTSSIFVGDTGFFPQSYHYHTYI